MSENKNELTFFIEGEEVITINQEGFFYKGQFVHDKYDVYERFSEWLKIAEIKQNEQ